MPTRRREPVREAAVPQDCDHFVEGEGWDCDPRHVLRKDQTSERALRCAAARQWHTDRGWWQSRVGGGVVA